MRYDDNLTIAGSGATQPSARAVPNTGDDLAARLPMGGTTGSDRNKAVVRLLIEEVMNAGRMDAVDELYSPRLAPAAKRWIAPFRASFPDVHMEVVDLIAEGDKVVGRFTCSGTHLGDWLGHSPTGRRFEAIDEVYFFRFSEGEIVHA